VLPLFFAAAGFLRFFRILGTGMSSPKSSSLRSISANMIPRLFFTGGEPAPLVIALQRWVLEVNFRPQHGQARIFTE
jgi:hypothetical protein